MTRFFRRLFHSNRAGPPPIEPLTPRQQRELDLLRERHRQRQRAAAETDEGGSAR